MKKKTCQIKVMIAQKKNPNKLERYKVKKEIMGSMEVLGIARTRRPAKNQNRQSRSEGSVRAGLHRTIRPYRFTDITKAVENVF
jgi:hypothetical protein